MATSGKDTGIVGYNVQAAVDTKHHLIVVHEVTNVGSDRHQLANMAEKARAELGGEKLDVVADRGYYEGGEIKACEDAGISVMLPKPQTSGAKAQGRFGKQDFVYKPEEGRLSLPCRRDAAVSLHERCGRQDRAPLLDRRVQRLSAQVSVHSVEGAAHFSLGARALTAFVL